MLLYKQYSISKEYSNNDLVKLKSLINYFTRTYQTLALIGGIFGIVVVPIILFSFAALLSIASVFDPEADLEPETLGELTAVSVSVSIIISIIAIVIVFALRKPKIVGYILFVLAFISIISTNISGIVTTVLFIVGGISAVRWKEELADEERERKSVPNSLEILKERYAKGEITKEEFETMKKDLE